MKRKQENKLWGKAKYSLEKHYRYICSNPLSKRRKLKEGFINIGLGGIIPDVIGIKDIGNQYSPKLEIITVEVKEHLPNYRERHMDQVRRSSVFAHKVFLAAPREFTPEEVGLAVEQKIGLFELDVKRNKLKLIVPSPTSEPSEGKVIALMRRLEFFKCDICNCYWNKNLSDITTGYRPIHYFSKDKQQKFVKFICNKCSKKLSDLHLGDLRERFVEEWKFKRFSKGLEKLSLKAKLLADKKEISRLKKKIKKQDEYIKNNRRNLIDSSNKKIRKLSDQLRRLKKSLKAI